MNIAKWYNASCRGREDGGIVIPMRDFLACQFPVTLKVAANGFVGMLTGNGMPILR